MDMTPSPPVPPRPDLPVRSSAVRKSRWRSVGIILATVAVLVIVAVAVIGGSDPPTRGVAVTWEEGRTYEFEIVSWAEGLTDSSEGATRRADAVEDVRFRIDELGGDGSVVASMQVTDRDLQVDGGTGTLRDPFTVRVELSPEGFVSSRFGFGVPTGVSEGTGLLSPGQFMPVFRRRDIRPGDRWEDHLSVDSLSGGPPLAWDLAGRFLGTETVNGRQLIHIEADLTTPAGTASFPDQGVEFVASEIVVDQDIYLDPETHQLILFESEQEGSVEIRALESGDVLVRFDGTLGLRVRSTS